MRPDVWGDLGGKSKGMVDGCGAVEVAAGCLAIGGEGTAVEGRWMEDGEKEGCECEVI